MYKAKKVRHGKYTVTPSFFTSDVGEFPRFKAYKVRITGHGDAGNPSAVYLTEVRIFALSEYATLEDRRKCGCDLPNRTSTAHQPVIQQPSPSIPSASPAKITAHIINRKPGGCQVLIQNTGGTAGRIYFQIWRYDHDYKKRVMAFDTGPNFLVPANYVVPIFPLFQYNTSDYQFLSPPIMH
jgi:hypothetical protein